ACRETARPGSAARCSRRVRLFPTRWPRVVLHPDRAAARDARAAARTGWPRAGGPTAKSRARVLAQSGGGSFLRRPLRVRECLRVACAHPVVPYSDSLVGTIRDEPVHSPVEQSPHVGF